jgi:hypothetical protein
MSGGPLWTPDRDRELIAMARAGLPGREIGEALGISRSAVGGRIHRLNRGQPEHLWLRLISNAPGSPPNNRQVPAKNPPPGPKLLIDLAPDDCRWPVNGGNPYVFCAKPKADGAYCRRHADLSRGRMTGEYRT